MWLVNMNCLGVLGKKLAGVKSRIMMKKTSFWGATYEEEVGEGCVKFF